MDDIKAKVEHARRLLERKRQERNRNKEEQQQQNIAAGGAGAGESAVESSDMSSEKDKVKVGMKLPSESAMPEQSAGAVETSSTEDSSPAIEESISGAKKQKVLSFSQVTQINLHTIHYNKVTQTQRETIQSEDEDNDSMEFAVNTHPPFSGSNRMTQTPMHKPAESPEHLTETAALPVEEKPVVREINEEERNKIIMSEGFLNFFNRASTVLERAMFEQVDVFADYITADRGDQNGGQLKGEELRFNRQFFDERWSKHRTVMSLDWSTQFPELLLACYNENTESPNEPKGVALVWNIKYKKTSPEFIFHCESPVTSACFAKFHPNLVFGGTYSGQIVLWDNRSHQRTPVMRTTLSARAPSHMHPVYYVEVVGSQNAHHLASVSTDGKMCFWNVDTLSSPQDSVELQNQRGHAVAAWCCAFPYGDFNNYVVGSEDGAVYTACRHGSKSGINEVFEGHQSSVTGIDCHSVPGKVDFSPYFLTSSLDWTVKLWNMKETRLVKSFEDNNDFVFDVKWSPIHPALFSTVTGSGRLDLWNLNTDTEVPTASVVVETNTGLNKCRWHQAGRMIAAGDDNGKVHIYDVKESLAVPMPDESSKFSLTLQKLEQEKANSNFVSQSPLR